MLEQNERSKSEAGDGRGHQADWIFWIGQMSMTQSIGWDGGRVWTDLLPTEKRAVFAEEVQSVIRLSFRWT